MSEAIAADSALTRWDRERAEEPFLFYRGPRGHMEWLSYEAAAKARSAGAPALPADLGELIGTISSVRPATASWLSREIGPPPPGRRDLWISWRSTRQGEERALLEWAVASGAAILVERSACFPADLAGWARPTLVNGPADDLGRWLDRLEAENPRWHRSSWQRRRLGRLRRMLIEGPPGSSAAARLEARFRGLSPESVAIVSPFPVEALV